MDGFDYASSQAQQQKFQNGAMVPTGGDSAYDAEFHMGRVPNAAGTDYTEVLHLRLRIPGDNNRVYDQPAIMHSTPRRPSDPERFPQAYANYQNGVNGKTGTPISELTGIEPGDARRLEMQNVSTIEGLAHLGDHQLPALGLGAYQLREAARRHVSGEVDRRDGERDAQFVAMQEKVAKQDAVLERLLGVLTPEQTAALTGEIEPRRGPGRPRGS